MKPRHAAALALVGWYLLSSPISSWAQSHTKIFTAPDGAFAFRYWENLIHCKPGNSEYAWDPGDLCMAFVPVCDGLIGPEHQTSIACFAYPRNSFTNTPAFEAATFSVETVNDKTTEKSCLAAFPDSTRTGTTVINGVSFGVNEFGEGASNQGTGGHAYRTFHRGKCYQLGVNFATANAEVFEPPVRELTDKDENEINGRLEQARKSFRFLK